MSAGLEEDDSRTVQTRGCFLLCAIDIRITVRAWSTLRNWPTLAITTEEVVASRMDCAVAKTKSSSLCSGIIWDRIPQPPQG
jgi:hypothetical protein